MLRLGAYLWAAPVTLLGLLAAFAMQSSGGSIRVVDGVIEACGGWPARLLQAGFPFSDAVAALTLGHVVLGVSTDALDATRAHERVHVRQFERWGVLLLVLYPLAGLLAWRRGGHPYRDNKFEREARAATPASSERPDSAGIQSTGR
ncbi:MAG: hypothetical protein AB1482_01355 [Pseudomonadota bacterium]